MKKWFAAGLLALVLIVITGVDWSLSAFGCRTVFFSGSSHLYCGGEVVLR